jgi:excinuclease ABC subunit C
MTLADPEVIALPDDAAVAALPQSAAVFLVWPETGAPYLGRTTMLGRRLARLVGERPQPSRMLNLRAVARRVEYWPTGSSLERSLVSYELARRHFPGEYVRMLRLRLPSFVKLIATNRFPRTQVTSRLGARAANLYYGPFPTRAAAEQFESGLLDLFQLRRCQEDLVPSPDHPGCIYGEMGRCLRPCQQAVGEEEYAGEARRVAEFLATGGASLASAAAAARDRLSAEMEFEAAAREHERVERIAAVTRLAGDLARQVRWLDGVAVAPSAETEAVELWIMRGGAWVGSGRLSLASGEQTSLDARLREVVERVGPATLPAAERAEHLALMVRWYHSTWRDGEWIALDGKRPYRRLVNAIHRVGRRRSVP